MAAAFELRGGRPNPRNIFTILLVDLKINEPPREAHHVAVVVLAEELGERRGDRGRAHAGHLICGDGHADTRAANEHAEICIARRNRLGNLNGIIRVIDGSRPYRGRNP